MSHAQERIARSRIDKVAERRAELGEAVLKTLGDLGYARTSLREIAQNSEFSHGVLHYYFSDKVDLILCSVRRYKAVCVTRYDRVTAEAKSFDQLMDGFIAALGETVRTEAPMHRLWYDLRSQALFEPALRDDVVALDKSLEAMIWRVMSRFAELAGRPLEVAPAVVYAMLDGLFQQCLLKHVSGDPAAIPVMQEQVRWTVSQVLGVPLKPATRRRGLSSAAAPSRHRAGFRTEAG